MKVLIVDPRAEWYVETLRPKFPDISIEAARSFVDAEPFLADAQVLMSLGVPLMGVHFTPEIARRMLRLEWVQCLVSGHEHIERALAGRNGILVTTAAGIHGPQMSEMAIMQMLMLSRQARTMLRNQDQHVWQRLPQRILATKVVGIVGMGSIGSHLARVCKAFGMTVFGVSRTPRALDCVDRMFPREDLVQVARELDYLTLLVPATAETEGLIGAEVFAAMKPSACIINLARGSVVDEDALIAALRRGAIAGAGLDVFTSEPLPPESPLWDMDNVIVTPHTGGPNDLYAEQTMAVVGPNLRAYLGGRREEMINVVRAS